MVVDRCSSHPRGTAKRINESHKSTRIRTQLLYTRAQSLIDYLIDHADLKGKEECKELENELGFWIKGREGLKNTLKKYRNDLVVAWDAARGKVILSRICVCRLQWVDVLSLHRREETYAVASCSRFVGSR